MDIQAIDNIRKNPKQTRAKATVNCILEATIQLLEEDKYGSSNLTTNHIAKRAGVSVGTLYQYFSNKDEILTILFFAYRQDLVAEISSKLAQTKFDNLSETLPQIIHILVRSFKSRLAARSSMVEQLLTHTNPAWTDDLGTISKLIQKKLASFSASAGIKVDLNPLNLFVLTQSVFGVIHNAARDRPEYLDDPEFEKQLTRLVWGFLS